MRIISVLFFYLLGLISSVSSIKAQEGKLIKLSELIPELENKYNVQFNYLESSVQQKISPPLINGGLDVVLKSLEKQTQLKFELIDQVQVIVRDLKSNDLITICGYVMTNGFPRAGINIESVVTLQSVVTDNKGYFEFNDIPYESNIVFREEDFFLKKLNVSQILQSNNCGIVELTEFNEELEEIIITNYLTKGVTKKLQKVSIIPTDFSILPGIIEPDVMKSLEHIPSVQSPFESPSKIYIRGSTPDQNLVLWNGIKTYSQSHFFGLLSAFNPYIINQIDFYDKGVQSKYGDRLAGVVDMKSGNKIYNKFSGGVGANLISADAFMKMPIIKDKISIETSFRRSYTDFIETPTYESMAERVFQNSVFDNSVYEGENEFYFLDYSLGIQAAPSKNDVLKFNLLYAHNNLVFESGTDINTSKDNLFTENEGYGLQWEHQYNKNINQETSITLSNYTLDYFLQSLEVDINNTESKKNFVNDYGGQTLFNFSFDNDSKWQLGYQYSNNIIRYGINNTTNDFIITLDEQKNKLQTNSLFSEYEINLNNKALIQLGARANKYSTNDQLFIEPRLYGEATLLPHLKINSSLTFTSQAITQIQESITSNLTLENVLWRITDDSEFNVLTSEHYSLGSTYKNKSWLIEGDVFYKLTENITTLTAGFLNPVNNDFNKGKSKTIGAELFIKKKFRKYSTWLSYTYTDQKSRFESINNENYFTSNLNIEHTIKWQHYYQLNNFQFSLGWLWNSGKATTNVTANKEEGLPIEILYENLNDQNLPIYHKLDLSILYNFKTNGKMRYETGLSIQNLYNRKNILNREFRTTPGIDNELISLDYYSLGFTPNLSFRAFW